MSYDVLVKTEVDNLQVCLTHDDRLIIADYSVPILQGPLDRNDAARLRPRMEQSDPRFNRLGAEQQLPAHDWPFIVAWALMGLALLPPRGAFVEIGVIFVASILTLTLALVRAEQIERARQGQRTISVMSGEMLLLLAAGGTVVVCVGLFALFRLAVLLPLGFEWFFGIIVAILVGAAVALARRVLRG